MKGSLAATVVCCWYLAADAAPEPLVIQHGLFGTDVDNHTFSYRAARAVLRSSDDAILACYRKGREKDRSLVATARLRVEILPSGKVANVTVEGVPVDVRDCVVATAARWTFKKTGEEFNVTIDHDIELFPLGYGAVLRPDAKPPQKRFPPHVNGVTEQGGGAMEREIQRRVAKLESCYTNELRAVGRLGGALVMELFLDANGTVYEASASGLMNKAVTDCVLGVLKANPFPKPTFRREKPEADVRFALELAPKRSVPPISSPKSTR